MKMQKVFLLPNVWREGLLETHNHYRSAIKFLYKKVLKILWDDDTVPAMKRERNLPAVLSHDEINAIIDATPNLKHKDVPS